jgi:hypothetical protein
MDFIHLFHSKVITITEELIIIVIATKKIIATTINYYWD